MTTKVVVGTYCTSTFTFNSTYGRKRERDNRDLVVSFENSRTGKTIKMWTRDVRRPIKITVKESNEWLTV